MRLSFPSFYELLSIMNCILPKLAFHAFQDGAIVLEDDSESFEISPSLVYAFCGFLRPFVVLMLLNLLVSCLSWLTSINAKLPGASSLYEASVPLLIVSECGIYHLDEGLISSHFNFLMYAAQAL
ncbi:hypothetical protein Ancab_026523 [Ancistrocladus abbreviatus]